MFSFPFNQVGATRNIATSLLKPNRLSLNTIITNLEKTVSTINQVVPLYNQVKPLITSSKNVITSFTKNKQNNRNKQKKDFDPNVIDVNYVTKTENTINTNNSKTEIFNNTSTPGKPYFNLT